MRCTPVHFEEEARFMATTVTPDDIKSLPIGTLYSGHATGEFEQGQAIPNDGKTNQIILVLTKRGFTYIHPQAGQDGSETQRVPCNDIGKAGGVGNAIVGDELPNGTQVRFEWLNLDQIKYEYWFSLSHKSGRQKNKPAQASATLIKEASAHAGKIIPPGGYAVRFEKGKHWAETRYTLAEDGTFQAEQNGRAPRAGSWAEVDGDFWLIDTEIHCYKFISRNFDGRSIELRSVPDSGPASVGYKATWTRL